MRVDGQHDFPIYSDRNSGNWLIISGVGQINAGAATEYLSEVSVVRSSMVWVNVGIAGSSRGNYGDLFLVDKIIQASTNKCFYMGTVVKTILKKSVLLTVDKPISNYNEVELVDMEGAAFANIASKISFRELVLVMKVVSDGPTQSADKITAQSASELISRNFSSIIEHVKKMTVLAKMEEVRFFTPGMYFDILKKWHFSVSQAHDLKKLVTRWQVAKPSIDVINRINMLSSSREVIACLEENLNNYEIDWTEV